MPKTRTLEEDAQAMEEAIAAARRELVEVRQQREHVQTRLNSATAKASYITRGTAQQEEARAEMVQLEAEASALVLDDERLFRAIGALEDECRSKYHEIYARSLREKKKARAIVADRMADGFEAAVAAFGGLYEALEVVQDAAQAWNELRGEEDRLRTKMGIRNKVSWSNYVPPIPALEKTRLLLEKQAEDFRHEAEEIRKNLDSLT